MADWNLSVALTGQGSDLAKKLRKAATEARSLSEAVKDAQGEIRTLGTETQQTAKQVRKLSSNTDTANTRLATMATQAKAAAKQVRKLERALADADTQVRAMANQITITADLDDQTGTGILAVRNAIDDLERLSPVLLNVQFDGDATQIAAAATAMADLRNDADNAGNALGEVARQAGLAATALNAAQNEAQDLSRVLRTLRGRAAAVAAALDDMADRARAAATGIRSLATAARTADGRLTTLSGNARTLRGDLDDLNGTVTRLGGSLGGLRGSLGSTSNAAGNASGNMRNLLVVAGLLATGIVPIAASLVPIAAGLTAAGVAAGAFGVAIGGQIASLMEAGEAQEKYDDAVREHGKSSEQAVTAEKEYLRQIAEMPAATREAAAAVSVLKDEYTEWSDALAADTMPVAIKGMGLIQAMLPKTTGLARGASAEFEHMLDVLAGASQTEGFDDLNEKFTEFATSTLAKATSGAVKFATALNTGEVGGDWREFMDYAREVSPQVGDTLSELATTMLHLLVAASDTGVGVLTLVEALAAMVNAVPTEVISTFLQLYAAIKLVTLGMAGFSAVAGGAALAHLATFRRSLMFGGVGPAITGVIQRMSLLQKATIGLGVLAVAAIGIDKLADKARGAPPDVDRLTTSLKNLAQTGEFTGELKKTFGDIDGFVAKVEEMTEKTKKLEESQEGGATGLGRVPLLDDVGDWISERIVDMKDGEKSLNALKEDFEAFDASMAQLASSGYGEQAAEDFALIKEALKGAGFSDAEINELVTKYKGVVENLNAEQDLAARGMGLFGEQAIAVKGKLDAQRASADGLRGAIQALNEVNRAGLGGMIAFEQSIDDTAKAMKEIDGTPLKSASNDITKLLDNEDARKAAAALQDLATKTDEAAASAKAADAPWQEIQGIYARGREELVKQAMAAGRTREQANLLAEAYLNFPDEKQTRIEMDSEDAVAGLDTVIAKMKETPGSKSVTVSALTDSAMQMLRTLGFTVERLPDGSVKVTANTGSAQANLAAVQNARDRLSDKTITITTHRVVTESRIVSTSTGESRSRDRLRAGSQADGGVVSYYAQGGMNALPGPFPRMGESHVAQIAPAGAMRVWAERETGGEAYVPLSPSKRPRSRAIVEETVRRLGGDPAAIQWNAQGSVTDWRYDPTTGSLYSPSDAGNAGRKTKKVKGKEVSYFDLGSVEKKLRSASSATRAWNRDLEKVAERAGGDVAEALASMGDEGVALARKMARGSTRYLNDMAAALRGLAVTARASLTDYTRQMSKATAMDQKFAKNLATLAGRGYGDLASQLAAQNDAAAQQLAEAAVKDSKRARSANSAAGAANRQLTADEVQSLVSIIAAIKTSKTGLHTVADTTGLGEDDIVSIATKARAQISSSLGIRATKFLADLARAQKGLSYANGGIRPGLYATQAGAVTFAEPQTGGEAFIPLGAHKRRQALPVLREAARRMGVGLTDVSASRQMVVIKEGGDTYITVPAVRTGASASDIGAQVGRSYRRAKRGGVSARA